MSEYSLLSFLFMSSKKYGLSNFAKQTSVAAMTSSFDVNRFPPSYFFMFGPKKKSQMFEAAIRSVILPALPWQLRMCELVRCHGEIALFSSPNGAVFSSILPRIGPIKQHSTAPWLSFPSPNSRWRWCLANPKKTVTINFPEDGTVFAFFGARSLGEVFTVCFISDV